MCMKKSSLYHGWIKLFILRRMVNFLRGNLILSTYFVPQKYMQIKVNAVKYYTMIKQRSIFLTAAVMEQKEIALNAIHAIWKTNDDDFLICHDWTTHPGTKIVYATFTQICISVNNNHLRYNITCFSPFSNPIHFHASFFSLFAIRQLFTPFKSERSPFPSSIIPLVRACSRSSL